MILLTLLGCLTYSDGQVQRGELNCELYEVCGELDALGFTTVDECRTRAAEQPYDDADCPGYDAEAMSTCIEAYRTAVDAVDCDAELNEVCQVCG